MDPLEQGRFYDASLKYLPETEELDRLDAFLTEMLARTQSELDRVTLLSPLTGPSPPTASP